MTPSLMLVFAIASATLSDSIADQPAESTDLSCGVLALYSFLKIEGQTVTLDTIRERLGPPSSKGHTLARLREAARGRGFDVEVRRLNGPIAALPAATLIAYTEPPETAPHYIVVRETPGGFVQILDGFNRPCLVRAGDLSATPGWTGVVLYRSSGLEGWVSIVGFCAIGLLLVVAARRRPR